MLFTARSSQLPTLRGKNLLNLLADKSGDFAEKVLYLVLAVIVAIGVVQALGVDITNAFQTVVDAL